MPFISPFQHTSNAYFVHIGEPSSHLNVGGRLASWNRDLDDYDYETTAEEEDSGELKINFGLECRVTRDRCYDFLNIFAEKFSEKIGVFCSNYCYFLQKLRS
jgi:hypothetical protein